MRSVKAKYKVKTNLRRIRLCKLVFAEMMREPNSSKDNISCFSACSKFGLKPQTLLSWVHQFGLSEEYANAREIMFDYEALNLDKIAEEPIEYDPDGRKDRTDLEQKRLRVDVKKWRMSHIAPRYNDRLKLEHSGNVSSLADIVAQQSKVKDAN